MVEDAWMLFQNYATWFSFCSVCVHHWFVSIVLLNVKLLDWLDLFVIFNLRSDHAQEELNLVVCEAYADLHKHTLLFHLVFEFTDLS